MWYDLSKNIRLKGVDASVYAYELKRVLSRIAALLGHEGDARAFEREAGKAREAVLEKMWDPDTGFSSTWIEPVRSVRGSRLRLASTHS